MQPEPTSRLSKPQKQLALIALLLIGLVVALKTQPTDLPKSTASTEKAELEISPVTMQSFQQNRETDFDPSLFTVTELPRHSLSVLENHSLFRRAVVARRQHKPTSLSLPVAVKAVYGDHAQIRTAALIGKEIVHPGHHLHDGLTVTDVSANGIKVSQ